MNAYKRVVFNLELNGDEFTTIKECLEVFESEGLNNAIKGTIGIRKLSNEQLKTLNKINNYLEVFD